MNIAYDESCKIVIQNFQTEDRLTDAFSSVKRTCIDIRDRMKTQNGSEYKDLFFQLCINVLEIIVCLRWPWYLMGVAIVALCMTLVCIGSLFCKQFTVKKVLEHCVSSVEDWMHDPYSFYELNSSAVVMAALCLSKDDRLSFLQSFLTAYRECNLWQIAKCKSAINCKYNEEDQTADFIVVSRDGFTEISCDVKLAKEDREDIQLSVLNGFAILRVPQSIMDEDLAAGIHGIIQVPAAHEEEVFSLLPKVAEGNSDALSRVIQLLSTL